MAKRKGLKNRGKNLSWYENIHSQEYDSLTINKLAHILKEFNNILKASKI